MKKQFTYNGPISIKELARSYRDGADETCILSLLTLMWLVLVRLKSLFIRGRVSSSNQNLDDYGLGGRSINDNLVTTAPDKLISIYVAKLAFSTRGMAEAVKVCE